MKQYRFIIFISILYIILLSYLPSTNQPTTTEKTKSGRGGRQYYAVHKVRRYALLKVMGFELGGWVLAADLTDQNPYRITVSSVANYRPHLSHVW